MDQQNFFQRRTFQKMGGVRRVSAIILVCLAGFCALSAQGQPSQIADSLWSWGNYEEARLQYGMLAIRAEQAANLEQSLYYRAKEVHCLTRKGAFAAAWNMADSLLTLYPTATSIATVHLLNAGGQAALSAGAAAKSEPYFRQALQTAQNLPKPDPLLLAECYTYSGIFAWQNADWQQASDLLNLALDLRQQHLPPQHPEIAAALNNLGLVYQREQVERAFGYYQQALELYKAAYSDKHPAVAITLNNMAVVRQSQKRFLEALNLLQQVYQTRIGYLPEVHPNIAFVYAGMAQVYAELRQLTQAFTYLKKAELIYRTLYGSKHPEIAALLNIEANWHTERQAWPQALSALNAAMAANSEAFSPEAGWYELPPAEGYLSGPALLTSLRLKASVLERRHLEKSLKFKDISAAYEALVLADEIAGQIRRRKDRQEDQLRLAEEVAEMYQDAVRICLYLAENTWKKRFYQNRAFYFAEKNRASTLLSSVAEANAKSYAGLPESLLEQEQRLKAEGEQAERRLAQSLNTEEEDEARAGLIRWQQTYKIFIARIEKEYPRYFQLKFETDIADASAVAAALPPQTALVSYMLSRKNARLYIFYITKKGVRTYERTLDPNFDRWLNALENALSFNIPELIPEQAYRLFEQLFPFRPEADIRQLVIIPDGRLGQLPFEALLTKPVANLSGEVPWLMRRYAISYHFSGTFLVRQQSQSAIQSAEVLFCAPVTFEPYGRISALPGSKTEVASIGQLLESNQIRPTLWMERKANEAAFKALPQTGYRFIHLATHGVVDPLQPALSRIYLHPEGTEDGILFAGELYNLPLQTDLVVLSACQTGLGRIAEGEGIIGLSRALAFAGAHNQVVSFWSVADESTAKLMELFYQHLMNNQTEGYAEALRQSKLALIAKGYESPFFWAPFVLIGL